MSLARSAGRVVDPVRRVEADDEVLIENHRIRAWQWADAPNGEDAVQGGGPRKASRGTAA